MLTISVILPLFSDSSRYVSRLPLIRRTLLALKGQLDTDFEIIAVDNGSTDDTYSLFRQFFPESLFLSFPLRKRRSASRNYGAQLSRGKYFLFLDCDCIPYPSFISNYKSFLTAFPSVVVQGPFYSQNGRCFLGEEFIAGSSLDYEALESSGLNLEYCGYRPSQSIFKEACQPLSASVRPANSVHSGNCLFPRVVFQELGGWDEDFVGWGYEDTWMSELVRRKGKESFFLTNVPTIHQCHREGADTSHVEDVESGSKNRQLCEQKMRGS